MEARVIYTIYALVVMLLSIIYLSEVLLGVIRRIKRSSLSWYCLVSRSEAIKVFASVSVAFSMILVIRIISGLGT